MHVLCGHSSVGLERRVAIAKVEGSSPFARLFEEAFIAVS